MLANSTTIGATTNGTTFADIIINNVNSVAEGAIQGFAQFVHDPKALKDTVSLFSKAAAPRKFADAVVLRRIETQKLDDIWNFPLNLSVATSCPLPFTVVEASVKSQMQQTEYEFNIMRTIDFVGRNYIRLVLPAVDCSRVIDNDVGSANDDKYMSDPDHMYLGAWHRDLIPRIVEKVEFYPRSNAHKLFEYTGYDIFVHNILFGNAHKEMNDLMSGEDKFELCYDPYRVDGSAMGLASFKGVDAFRHWSVSEGTGESTGVQTYKQMNQTAGQDGIVDFFQLDTTMDDEEFRDVYRRNVWYEAPIAMNYHARHSIHSRRMFHQKKEIMIPLDILPFGYSIASSLPSAALSGECGFIRIKLFADWLDRAFYLTKVSDVPSLHPLVNHRHYAPGNLTSTGYKVVADDRLDGWVNDRSVGKFGDPSFNLATPDKDEDDDNFTLPGNLLNAGSGADRRENIVPTTLNPTKDGAKTIHDRSGRIASTDTNVKRVGNFRGVNRVSTTNSLTTKERETSLTTSFIHKMSMIDKTYFNEVKQEIGIKLLQVGYQTLPCIREFLSKLPNIYITTEWDNKDCFVNDQSFDINNDLYIQAIMLWFIPTDNNGIESMRLYPCHMIDHELPVIAGLELVNEQSQGNTTYDWQLLNVFNPAQMGLSPLLENMGLISFSPMLNANSFPYSFYDSNINGYLKCRLLMGEGNERLQTCVNMKQGYFKVISIGINGVALVNLNMFRLIF